MGIIHQGSGKCFAKIPVESALINAEMTTLQTEVSSLESEISKLETEVTSATQELETTIVNVKPGVGQDSGWETVNLDTNNDGVVDVNDI